MLPVATDQVERSVGLSICLSVYHSRDPCDVIWDVDSGGHRSHVLDGVHIPMRSGNLRGVGAEPGE